MFVWGIRTYPATKAAQTKTATIATAATVFIVGEYIIQ